MTIVIPRAVFPYWNEGRKGRGKGGGNGGEKIKKREKGVGQKRRQEGKKTQRVSNRLMIKSQSSLL